MIIIIDTFSSQCHQSYFFERAGISTAQGIIDFRSLTNRFKQNLKSPKVILKPGGESASWAPFRRLLVQSISPPAPPRLLLVLNNPNRNKITKLRKCNGRVLLCVQLTSQIYYPTNIFCSSFGLKSDCENLVIWHAFLNFHQNY